MMSVRKLFIAAGLFALPLLLLPRLRAQELDFVIYQQGQARLFEAMIEELCRADVVFIGEQHDHKRGHELKRDILQAMHRRCPDLVLSLEMFERDTQLVVDEYLAGLITESAFLAASRPWPNYRTDYRPLVEFCKENRLPVIAANAPRRYVNIVSRKGQGALKDLSREAKSFLAPLPYAMDLPPQYDKQLTELFGGQHNTAQPPPGAPPSAMPSTENMKQAQGLWDATMADSILRGLRRYRGRKILQVNGAMHSDSGFGIVDRLRRAAPRRKALIVTIRPDPAFPNQPPGKYEGVADFVILTPSGEKKP